MQDTLHVFKDQALEWLRIYGDLAVVPALLADPGGVPWFWIFLMLLAEKAGKNIYLLLVYGMIAMNVADHITYWVGYIGGRPLLNKLGERLPKLAKGIADAECSVRGKGIWAVIVGRFLPFIGRWVGLASGLVRIPYTRFTVYNLIGSAITVLGFGLVAHVVGEKTVDQPWFPAALVICVVGGVVVSLGGFALQAFLSCRKKNNVVREPKDVVEKAPAASQSGVESV